MIWQLIFLGVLCGVDNLQVCTSLSLLPIARARLHRLALAFAVCEMSAALAGLTLGRVLPPYLDMAGSLFTAAVIFLCGCGLFRFGMRPGRIGRWLAHPTLAWTLPLALSLDNLGAATASGTAGYPAGMVVLTIGAMGGIMSASGLYFGAWVRRFLPSRAAGLAGAYLCLFAVRMAFVELA